jgi:aryl-alcohol dehydrogenase-like predicted oxidoreductase
MSLDRRRFLLGAGLTGLALKSPFLFANSGSTPNSSPITRKIPGTDEAIPAIGMGTWITFNVGGDPALVEQRTEVLKTFFDLGGTMVDGSPMYGTASDVVGEALEALGARDRVFAATKIWTSDESATRQEADRSGRRWGVDRFDLLQVHNLRGWQGHLEALKAMKDEGAVRYIGITTSHGRRHRAFAQIMEDEPIDFVQLTYNLLDREAEQRLLPLAREKGIAVIVNRPFQGGSLFRRFEGEPLPGWAGDAGVNNWAEFFLKYIVSHPAVTCAIPATTKVAHMRENMGALYGALPDEQQRQRMADYVRSL